MDGQLVVGPRSTNQLSEPINPFRVLVFSHRSNAVWKGCLAWWTNRTIDKGETTRLARKTLESKLFPQRTSFKCLFEGTMPIVRYKSDSSIAQSNNTLFLLKVRFSRSILKNSRSVQEYEACKLKETMVG